MWVFWYVLRWTAFGTHVFATGDDPQSARLAGIRTRRVLMSVYGLAGVLCAIAGWVLIGRTGVINSQAGYTSNLDSITAVVIGGTSLFGGRGSIFLGTMIGPSSSACSIMGSRCTGSMCFGKSLRSAS